MVVATGAELTAQPFGGAESAPGGPIMARLSESSLDPAASMWVAAAMHSDDAVAACANGETIEVAMPSAPAPAPEHAQRYYLGRVEVQGFRGIGRTAVLELAPTPGLNVIVGRNGSGKSSFAEAVEAALTGRNQRWDAMPSAWRDGWRNLHVDELTQISVDVHIPDAADSFRVVRQWTGDSVRSARGEVRHSSGQVEPLSRLGWSDELVRYRPFLSYDELGRAVTGRSAELYDTLTELLGLTELTEAERRLAKACDRLAKRESRPRRDLAYLLEQLESSGDPRAKRAAELLRADTMDLDRLASIAADDAPADSGRERVLRRLRRLSVPERALMSDVVNELRGAAMELAMAADSKGARARDLIQILRAAMAHTERHPDESSCPVCQTEGALDREWMDRARAEVARLEPAAAGAAAAYDRADNARDQARFLMAPRPSWLPETIELGQIWEKWAAGAHLTDLGEIAKHIEEVGPRLRAAAVAARKAATARLEDPTDGWAELASLLGAWVDDARAAARCREILQPAGHALEWFGAAARELRQQRLRPLASRTEYVWQRLRQERRIDMEAMRLVGRGAQRRLAVDVRVDGRNPGDAADGGGNAPGLLSQGEFQALALSICLPRTLMAGNPFGFLVLDDPVQAMDTETVEGLASVLAEVGQQRQLVVFTHDTRLSDALQRLQLPARIRTIHRDEMSNVRVQE